MNQATIFRAVELDTRDLVATGDLLAHSQRLEALLSRTNSDIRSLEEQLSSSESLAAFGHFKIDREDRFLLSHSASMLLGVPAGAAFLDQALCHANAIDQERLAAAIRLLMETGAQVDEEIALDIPMQGTRWLRIVVRRTQSSDSADLYGLIVDTSEARREAIRRDIALQVSQALLQDVDSQDAYEWALEKVCTGLGWDIGSCWLTGAAADRLRCLAVWTRSEPALQRLAFATRGREVAAGEGMVGVVLQTRVAAWSENVGGDARFAEQSLAARAGVLSAYTFPIVVEGGQCVGVLQFLSRSPRQFDAQLPALSGLIGTLLAQRARRETWIARLRAVAEHDAVTGLYTRYAIREQIARLVTGVDPVCFAVCTFDLNRFKLINDGLGHGAGDLVLKTIAERVGKKLPADTQLARLGGDEFAAIIRGGDTETSAAVESIAECLRDPLHINGYEFSLTVSTGVARFPGDGSDPDALLKEADIRRHRGKRANNGISALGGARVRANPLAEIQIEHELRGAIEAGELIVHYQPIMRMGEPGLAGAEALIRWRHPRRGLLLPEEFLGVAEQTGMSRAISRTVLAQVTRDLAGAGNPFAPDFRVNVNLSALDFRDLKLFKELGVLLREAGMAPQRFRFEVTESMLMEDVATAERVVGLLTDYGVEFAIDDFGAGYSSLAQLSRLAVHELKIDHSFTQSIDTKRGKAVVRAVLDLASRLEMPVTAEGIETRAQALALTAFGCAKGQGYLYARPMTFAGLLDFIRPAAGSGGGT